MHSFICYLKMWMVLTLSLFGLDHALVGIYAINTETGEVLIDQNSDMSLIPASCMKIITTAAALHVLGPEKRFCTELAYDGCIDAKILHGNLYIKGEGDPCLGSDRISGSLSWEKQIQAWADAIQKLGILKIEGQVVGDASKWEKALAVPSWSWEDLGNYYGAGACSLSFHENAYFLVFKPGSKEGEAASIARTEPPLPSLVLNNEVKTGPAGSGDQACIYGSEWIPVQYVRGTIPSQVDEFTIKGAIPDPAALCADLLTRALQKRKITVANRNPSVAKERQSFHKTVSPTIAEIVYWTNQKSVNLYAEHLLKSMGDVVFNDGSTRAGLKAVAVFLTSQKIDLGGFNMVDGCGLSRKNLVTAKQFVSLLTKMKKSDQFPLFYASLPEKQGSIRAKSGSMSLITCYVGYSGEIAFAILINQCSDSQRMNAEINEIFSRLRQI